MKDKLSRVFGAYDEEVALNHLNTFPLQDGFVRQYTDHTGRFFQDIDPSAPIDHVWRDLYDILSEETQKEINSQLISNISK